MKRFAAIVTIAVVVLAMSAGTAFASVCVGSACGRSMVCSLATTAACPMENGALMSHSSCDHQPGSGIRDVVAPQPQGSEYALVVVTPGPVLAPLALSGVSSALLAPDARGAPHLTSVIRI